LGAGKSGFKFLIVGEGNEREWLEKNMKTAEFTGFLDGEKLSEAYANIDVFLFPSETDAFGNVIQEANASGVPAIVTDQGGPKFIVRHGETGFVAKIWLNFTNFRSSF
jgi:phosphatidylinositol alpha 1,6-mannosyltransferase